MSPTALLTRRPRRQRSEVAEQISRAADLIERDGHTVGRFRASDGRRCIANALAAAADVPVYEESLIVGSPKDWGHPVFGIVADALAAPGVYPPHAICTYNNENTTERVVAKLREIAATV